MGTRPGRAPRLRPPWTGHGSGGTKPGSGLPSPRLRTVDERTRPARRWRRRTISGIRSLSGYPIPNSAEAHQGAGADPRRHGSVASVGRGRPPARFEPAIEVGLVIDDDPPQLTVSGRITAHTPFGKRRFRNAEIFGRLAGAETTGGCRQDSHDAPTLWKAD